MVAGRRRHGHEHEEWLGSRPDPPSLDIPAAYSPPPSTPPVTLRRAHDHQTRSGANYRGWTVKSPKFKSFVNLENDTETYPMIHLPNPHGDDTHPVMYVYRPWTNEDVKKATEGIPHPKTNSRQFEQGVRNLYESYRLNGTELKKGNKTNCGR